MVTARIYALLMQRLMPYSGVRHKPVFFSGCYKHPELKRHEPRVALTAYQTVGAVVNYYGRTNNECSSNCPGTVKENLYEKPKAVFWIINFLMPGFLFGEQAVKNIEPLASEMLSNKR